MKLLLLTGLITLLASGYTDAASTFSPARPPAVPLAVRSPYLSTWLNGGNNNGPAGVLPGNWPVHWANQLIGWAGQVRVDGTSYTWMGHVTESAFANQVSAEYTSTKSIFKIDVGGKVNLTATFMSPVTPHDLKRQSLIASYLDIQVESADGASHKVELYSDISAEWVSGDHREVAQWSFGKTDGVAYHKIWKQNQQHWSEAWEQAEWGNWYWATDDDASLTISSGEDNILRSAFRNTGKLDGSQDTNYRPIQQQWPVFAFARDLGDVTTAKNVLFTINLAQDEPVQFAGSEGYKPVPSLWRSYFTDELSALSFFHKDFSDAFDICTSLDNQVVRDSTAVGGPDYATITSLTVRQAFGATVLGGTQDKQYLFLKEISSNGNFQTVDVIFPFHPILVYTNPELIKLLLDPLFENQESGQYPNKYSMHDMGSHFPNATGHPDGKDEEMPLEECGNMLIMSLAYAQRTGNTAYLTAHYDKLKQWSGYLVDEALIPAEQLSTDDFAGHLVNQTNLALKGIIGIAAMGQIANLTAHPEDAVNYDRIAHEYITKWQDLGIAKEDNPPHTTLQYGNNASHGVLYNLYCDRELGLNVVPQSVYDMQSSFYPTVMNKYGVPLDTRHSYTKADWLIFAAAVANSDTQTKFISNMATWIKETVTDRPLTDIYETETGNFANGVLFTARPVMGGVFALLALPKSAVYKAERDVAQ